VKSLKSVAACGLAALMLTVTGGAQSAAGTKPKAAAAPVAALPAAPVAAAAPVAGGFPPVNPKFFTAATPTVETVNGFLKSLWGYDENRIWSVVAILATNAPGVSKVVIVVGDKAQPGKTTQTVFFTTPDGHHAIADNVIEFGATPFEATRKLLQARADGPVRGAKGKELLLVEFSDLQCPHCKDAQAIMDQLVTDFPQARVVFQNLPLTEIHPFAFEAAAVGLCVRQAKGDDAFFKYAQNVFDNQAGLTADGVAKTLETAVARAGGDAAAAAACAKTPATVAAVNASVQVAKDAGVDSTPMLMVNGQPLPLTSVPYEVLKKIIVYRAGMDGVQVMLQPSLKTLK
jgi:protein-disulfide isomerase